jgi:hypothetical protein
MKLKQVLVTVLISVFAFSFLYSEELPKPTYDNSVMFAWTHYFLVEDSAEIDYMKGQFGNGIYAPLLFTNFYGVYMDWDTNPSDSGNGISSFKSKMGQLVAFGGKYNVGMHMIINYGISRKVTYYNDAKIEDIRNAQWYNDNNLSTQSQQSRIASAAGAGEEFPFGEGAVLDLDHTASGPGTSTPTAGDSVINKYVFTTFSRYARKLRAHLEAKVASAYDYLQKVQTSYPDITFIVSAPGESELNYFRIQGNQTLQDYFCDYSPFAILEFRDWITHEGLYAAGQKYDGEGYSGGGANYQGAAGLAQFNADFGASFSSWDLKYYDWNLTDPVDTDYTDGANPDTNAIPVSSYSYDGMMPGSGSNYISGGFDAPRTMQGAGVSAFYDLWTMFRELLVYNYVKDMTEIARDSGFPKAQYYTHQIPGDYLFGTRPNDPNIPKLNPRYHSSASPLWTAKNYTDVGVGVTIYDIKYPGWFARTSKYAIEASDALSDNWAALEYHPEVIPIGINSTISDVSTIYNEMIRLYNGNPHVISFFKWMDSSPSTSEYRYKGNNRETAAKQFFNAIKDKARQPVSTVFTPKQVEGFSGSYNAGRVNLNWSSKIWTDLIHTWSHWGDFKEFAVYRGYTSDFTPNGSSKIAGTTNSSYTDTDFAFNTTVYYKIAAVNSSGGAGPVQTVSVVTPDSVPIPILDVSRDSMTFGYILGGNNPPTQSYRISNTGTGTLNWTATDDAEWLSCSPDSGMNGAEVTVSVDPTGLAAGSYTATITVADPLATDSPQTIGVTLTVKNSSQAEDPFGSFDTPIDDSTVRSSIPVTGWALDDTGIENVKLYRDPVTNEGKNLIYIGDAVFVEGARPDIELAYPTYPANHKAGWGYMMLTNFLPAGGNGTFTFYAVAKDSSGNEVTLGNKTVTIDNANAVKPFGAIDTPTQGGSASGGKFINWGWVLTPQPSSIPTDGSTIKVFVDGVNIGNPTYNIYRSDIANLFPTYANSSGAIGYFYLDTTVYNDGVHTIQWLATDNNSNTDGIGSRYFTIQNSGNDAGQSTTAKYRAAGFVNGSTPSLSPVRVSKGYGKEARNLPFTPDQNGQIHVNIRETERVVISAGNPDKTFNWTAFQVVADELRPLPAGATFDPGSGTLYWLPGYGFYGKYTFLFVSGGGALPGMKPSRVTVKINIGPKFDKFDTLLIKNK